MLAWRRMQSPTIWDAVRFQPLATELPTKYLGWDGW